MNNIGYVEGYISHNSVNHCPQCGTDNLTYKADGSVKCDECRIRFGIIEIDESEEEDE